MAQEKHWYLVCYDIREHKRWAKAHKIVKGCGERLQYSIFRIRMSRTQLEALRWRLCQVLEDEDSLMIVRLCAGCAERVVDSRGREFWQSPGDGFEVF